MLTHVPLVYLLPSPVFPLASANCLLFHIIQTNVFFFDLSDISNNCRLFFPPILGVYTAILCRLLWLLVTEDR